MLMPHGHVARSEAAAAQSAQEKRARKPLAARTKRQRVLEARDGSRLREAGVRRAAKGADLEGWRGAHSRTAAQLRGPCLRACCDASYTSNGMRYLRPSSCGDPILIPSKARHGRRPTVARNFMTPLAGRGTCMYMDPQSPLTPRCSGRGASLRL